MLDYYRKWLVGLWSAGFLIPFILILFQFGSGKYGEKSSEALGWLTALTLSTILLMIGVIISNPAPAAAVAENNEDRTAAEAARTKAAHERFIFKLAVGVSLLYLLIVNLVFFVEPLVGAKPQALMRESKIYLAVFDSIISLLIGYFFGKR